MDIQRARQIASQSHRLTWDESTKSWALRPADVQGLWLVAEDAKPTGRSAWLSTYTGQAVLVDFDKGQVVYGPFPIATHPGQKRTNASDAADVNGDGLKDVAWTLPRVAYPMVPKVNSSGRHNPVHKFQAVQRDVGGFGVPDPLWTASYPPPFKYVVGWLTAAEAGIKPSDPQARVRPRIYQATLIQFHAGNKSGPSSIGCWTSPPDVYKKASEYIQRHGQNWHMTFERSDK